jgi:hypothetical protein
MSTTVWLAARTIDHLDLGGHFWFHLNWALGLRALGCDVVWLEPVGPDVPADDVQTRVAVLKSRLRSYGLGDRVSLCSWTDKSLTPAATVNCVAPEEATEADMLLNMAYGIPSGVVERFRRSAFLDTDPGLTQFWIRRNFIRIAPHTTYFTIGETVAQAAPQFLDCEIAWHYTPLCVALERWPAQRTTANAPFTTVSNWEMNEWMEGPTGWYRNDKRTAFLPYVDLPNRVPQPLELALFLGGHDDERVALEQKGWRVREAHEVVATPDQYQSYITDSGGEFSCAKPSYVHLQTAWISDRTLCYLASGKPAVVQHTGPSRFLPDAHGLFRFRNVDEAAGYLEMAQVDYSTHCAASRALAEEYFDARKVVGRVLERTLA